MADGVLSRNTLRGTNVRRALALAVVLASLCPSTPAFAQAYQVVAEAETFRKTADGRRLADLTLGAMVTVTRTEGSWSQVRIEGWVPSDALGPTTREGRNGIVTRVGGIDMRTAPADGAISAHLLQGFLLDRMEEREGWTRVERTGWVRTAAVEPVVAGGPGARPLTGAEVERPPALVAEGRRLTTGDEPLEIRKAPDGDRLAVVVAGAPVTVVERGGRWTRVRFDGWVRSDQLAVGESDSVVVEVSAGELRARPDDFLGVRVAWTVQFVSLERAEPERTDFYEGEPFILARAPDPGDRFVYIAVPPELVGAVEELQPLQNIEILAQVRTGRSSLMGVPILDLLALF